MAFNDILLQIDTYPEPTPDAMVEAAVGFAATVGGKVSALALQLEFPVMSNRVADYLIGLSQLAQQEADRCLGAAKIGLSHFSDVARKAGVLGDTLIETSHIYDAADRVAARARTRDLCIVPLADRFDGQQQVAQSVIFDSGRPLLAIGPDAKPLPKDGIGLVVLAWDASRSAARAMADAMPILTQARAVHVLTVVNDKPAAVGGMGAEVVRHLTLHGVNAVAREIDAADGPIGKALDGYLTAESADILVMGAYGHSRLREFVLGGATEHMLREPPVAVFLSH